MTMTRREEIVLEALHEAEAQITYFHCKFQETGSGNSTLAKIQTAISAIAVSAFAPSPLSVDTSDLVRRLEHLIQHPTTWAIRDDLKDALAALTQQAAEIERLMQEHNGHIAIIAEERTRAEKAEAERDDLARKLDDAVRVLKFYANPPKKDADGEEISIPDFYSEMDFGEYAHDVLARLNEGK